MPLHIAHDSCLKPSGLEFAPECRYWMMEFPVSGVLLQYDMADIPLIIHIMSDEFVQRLISIRSNFERTARRGEGGAVHGGWRNCDVSAHCQHVSLGSTDHYCSICQPTLMLNAPPDHQTSSSPPLNVPTDCLSCRIVGSGALGATGLYALNQARPHQPGSLVGKRIMAGIGVLFLLGSVARWRK